MDEKEKQQSREKQQFDQSSAELADMFPPQWWRLYSNLQKEGFTPSEALELVKMWILVLMR